MARTTHDTMMEPPVENLLGHVDSKFRLVTLAARRARQINSYFNHLGDSMGAMVPPQVTSVARKPLSIAFEEIAADKIEFVPVEPGDELRASSRVPSSRCRCRGAGRGRACRRRVRRVAAMTSLAGRRVVLGVTGGIAAYKAVEVCRRLIDSGAHVVPVMTKGAERFVGPHDVVGAGLRARAHLAVGRRRPHPAHAPRPVGRPGAGGPGHGPCARRLRRGHLERPAHRHAARHPGAGAGLPGHAHRDVGAPRGAGEPGHPPAPRRHRGRARVGPPGRWRRRGGAAGLTRAHRGGRRAGPGTARPRRPARRGHRGRHPRGHRRRPGPHQPLVGQAGLRHRRRGRRPGRGGHAGDHRRPSRPCPASPWSTSSRPPRWRTPSCASAPPPTWS